MTMASAMAGLTRWNCLICRHQTPRSPVPSFATCSPAAQRPSTQKEKARDSRYRLQTGKLLEASGLQSIPFSRLHKALSPLCSQRDQRAPTPLQVSLSPPPTTATGQGGGHALEGALSEGLGEGAHMLTQLPPRVHQQHIHMCPELQEYQGLRR